MVSGRVMYRGVLVRVLGEKESCRYLRFWGTANGDMSETKRRVMEKTKEARCNVTRLGHRSGRGVTVTGLTVTGLSLILYKGGAVRGVVVVVVAIYYST